MTVYIFALFLVSTLLSVTQSRQVIGRFDNRDIPLDFQFGENSMLISTQLPPNAPPSLRPTNNLHIFSEGLVAIKSPRDRACYVQKFNATMTGMRQKVQTALAGRGYFEGVQQEAVFTGNMEPLPSWLVSRLPSQIQQYCLSYDIFPVTDNNSELVRPSEFSSIERRRRCRPAQDFTNRRRFIGRRGRSSRLNQRSGTRRSSGYGRLSQPSRLIRPDRPIRRVRPIAPTRQCNIPICEDPIDVMIAC